MKIRHQLSLITVAFLAIALILMSTFFYFYVSNVLKQKSMAFLEQSMVSGSLVIQNLIEARRVEAVYLSQNQLVLETIEDYVINKKAQEDSIPEYAKTNQLFYSILSSGRGIRAAFIIEPSGKVISSGQPNSIGLDLADRDYFQKAIKGRETISNLLFDRLDGLPSLFVASPIYSSDNKMVIGVMALIIDTQITSDSLRSLINEDMGNAYLMNVEGMIIFHTDLTLIGTYHRDEKTRTYFSQRQPSEKGHWNYTYGGEDYYIVYCSITSTPWTLVIEQNMDTFMATARQTLWALISIFSFILVAAGISYGRYARFFTQPIRSLSEVMHKTTKGDLTIRSEYISNNELGHLSNDLNIMLDELVGAYEEVDEGRKHIEELAFTYPLTHLANRTAYNLAIEDLISTEAVNAFSLIHVDVDSFMRVNYSLGHRLGDLVLIEIATRLNQLSSEEIRIFHVSADKFALLITGEYSEFQLIEIVRTVNQQFNLPLVIEHKEIFISLSLGISSYPIDSNESESLKNQAETALYEAKNTGKSKHVFYRKIMTEIVNQRMHIESLLRRAVRDGLLLVMYQPQYKPSGKNPVAFEALMRLQQEDGKYISPVEFIPIAEDTGLIIELSEWLFRDVFQQAFKWINEGFHFDYLCVNISGLHLKQSGFADFIIKLTREIGIKPDCVELEITESILLDISENTQNMLQLLKKEGFRIALDDFGTGFSSLSYLRTLPLSTLKIDKTFIDELVTSKKDQELVRQIIELAHELDLIVVAEGVEIANQLAVLESYRCDLIQGYFFSKPLKKDDAASILVRK